MTLAVETSFCKLSYSVGNRLCGLELTAVVTLRLTFAHHVSFIKVTLLTCKITFQQPQTNALDLIQWGEND